MASSGSSASPSSWQRGGTPGPRAWSRAISESPSRANRESAPTIALPTGRAPHPSPGSPGRQRHPAGPRRGNLDRSDAPDASHRGCPHCRRGARTRARAHARERSAGGEPAPRGRTGRRRSSGAAAPRPGGRDPGAARVPRLPRSSEPHSSGRTSTGSFFQSSAGPRSLRGIRRSVTPRSRWASSTPRPKRIGCIKPWAGRCRRMLSGAGGVAWSRLPNPCAGSRAMGCGGCWTPDSGPVACSWSPEAEGFPWSDTGAAGKGSTP